MRLEKQRKKKKGLLDRNGNSFAFKLTLDELNAQQITVRSTVACDFSHQKDSNSIMFSERFDGTTGGAEIFRNRFPFNHSEIFAGQFFILLIERMLLIAVGYLILPNGLFQCGKNILHSAASKICLSPSIFCLRSTLKLILVHEVDVCLSQRDNVYKLIANYSELTDGDDDEPQF